MRIKIKSGTETLATAAGEEENWERGVLEKLLTEVYREQRRARVWKLIFRLFWLLVLLAVLATCVGAQKGETLAAGPHTAVINLEGVIGGQNDTADMLRGGLQAAYAAKNVRGIIIRANSPGGSPTVSNTAFSEIRYFKKQHPEIPVYVVAEDVCASGCYYIAAAADKIYADPSSLVGSIGVIASDFDLTGLIDKLGVKRRVKIAGSNKDMGDPFAPETEEQKQIWQQMLDEIHQNFITAVREGRSKRLDADRHPEVFSGRVFTGGEALKLGLIDGYGNVYSIARNELKAPKIVDYTPDEWSKNLSRMLSSEVQNGISGAIRTPW